MRPRYVDFLQVFSAKSEDPHDVFRGEQCLGRYTYAEIYCKIMMREFPPDYTVEIRGTRWPIEFIEMYFGMEPVKKVVPKIERKLGCLTWTSLCVAIVLVAKIMERFC